VNLRGADLSWTNLKDIRNWKEIDTLKGANLFEVVNPPGGFLEWALGLYQWNRTNGRLGKNRGRRRKKRQGRRRLRIDQ